MQKMQEVMGNNGENSRIPVTIITGFLGSGKTTLLNNLIKKYASRKFAIIENEFGEMGIDGDLIVNADGSIYELSNGCICCSLSSDFVDTIHGLLDKGVNFDHLLVETTGIADPTSIIKAFISAPGIQDRFVMDSVICLADAMHMDEMISNREETRKQIALADIVLINKTESVSPTRVDELVRNINSINPMAQIYPVSYAQIDDLDILETFAYSGRSIETSILNFRPVRPSSASTPDPAYARIQHPSTLQHDIRSEAFAYPGNFDMQLFSFWMENFLAFNKDTVLRVKGIISFGDMEEKLIFHAVRGSYMFEKGKAWGDEERFSKLVFIGIDLDREALDGNLGQLMQR